MKKNGRCIELAMDFVLTNNDPNVMYCEGVVINSKTAKPMRHAWVEAYDQCLDSDTGIVVPKDLYYTIGQITKIHKFNQKQVRDHILETEIYSFIVLTDDDGL